MVRMRTAATLDSEIPPLEFPPPALPRHYERHGPQWEYAKQCVRIVNKFADTYLSAADAEEMKWSFRDTCLGRWCHGLQSHAPGPRPTRWMAAALQAAEDEQTTWLKVSTTTMEQLLSLVRDFYTWADAKSGPERFTLLRQTAVASALAALLRSELATRYGREGLVPADYQLQPLIVEGPFLHHLVQLFAGALPWVLCERVDLRLASDLELGDFAELYGETTGSLALMTAQKLSAAWRTTH